MSMVDWVLWSLTYHHTQLEAFKVTPLTLYHRGEKGVRKGWVTNASPTHVTR